MRPAKLESEKADKVVDREVDGYADSDLARRVWGHLCRGCSSSLTRIAIDPSVLVPDWPLNERGSAGMQAMAAHPWASGVRHIFSGSERKARDGAQVLAEDEGDVIRNRIESHHPEQRFFGIARLCSPLQTASIGRMFGGSNMLW
jgi:hypothetical protein